MLSSGVPEFVQPARFSDCPEMRTTVERRRPMKIGSNRRNLLAFMAMGLLLVAMLSIVPSAWATPPQGTAAQQTVTVPPIKSSDKALVSPGENLVFEILVNNPATASDTWTSSVVTDEVDSNLRIDNVITTQGTASWVGQTVTVNIGDVPPGTNVTIRIYCTVRASAPIGYEVVNSALLAHSGYPPRASTPVTVIVEEEFVPEATSLLLVSSGLAGLAWYSRVSWRARRRQPNLH
jgi:fimbrial isopeptide formation D2 family protein